MGSKLKLTAVALGILMALLSLLAMLQLYRFKQLLIEVESTLVSVPALALRNDVERSLALGVNLRDNVVLGDILKQTRHEYPIIVSIHLIGVGKEAGSVFWQDGPNLASPGAIAVAQGRAPKVVLFDTHDPGGYILSWPVADPIGQIVANLTVRFDKNKPLSMLENTGISMLHIWLALSLSGILILLPVLWRFLSRLGLLVEQAKTIILKPGTKIDADSEIEQLAEQVAVLVPVENKA